MVRVQPGPHNHDSKRSTMPAQPGHTAERREYWQHYLGSTISALDCQGSLFEGKPALIEKIVTH
ncbi:hypothetical protein NJF44_04600 [Pseudomonas guariconensis]|uniref:hypothetical protein n=1 Tax=Pseudomonas TaxID=286 RepID=UPI001CE3F64D|nr:MULTISPECIES: hypothetical protein [Pseudomonas]MCO7565428.1 hypothetical protein [Pseudomonas mosselii]MCO7595706.1 hypothetical protein [Pseudomonas guariconensis]MCO7604517.1 hypothetical protein [Pseudomonas guariconensis]MCO7616688.1 hypothetical protein [Pseudomonas guariconensis]MCU7220387.1 hypothetical protein [Pseudomonas brassicacearum]